MTATASYISGVPVELQANLSLNENHLAITALVAVFVPWTVSGTDFACNKGHLNVDGKFSQKSAQHSASSSAKLVH